MNFSSFFITRPIFAIVLSLLIVLGGLLALFRLPIGEYPGVVPPTRSNAPVARPAFPIRPKTGQRPNAWTSHGRRTKPAPPRR